MCVCVCVCACAFSMINFSIRNQIKRFIHFTSCSSLSEINRWTSARAFSKSDLANGGVLSFAQVGETRRGGKNKTKQKQPRSCCFCFLFFIFLFFSKKKRGFSYLDDVPLLVLLRLHNQHVAVLGSLHHIILSLLEVGTRLLQLRR